MWQSVKEYVPAVLKKWQGLIISIAGIIGIIINIWQELVVPSWTWVIIIIAGLIIAQFLAFHELSKKQAKPPENWIDAHKAETGKLPPLPDCLARLFRNYAAGQPVSKAMKPIIPSGQTWNRLRSREQRQWRQVIEWLGEDPEDYLEDMRKMFPKKSPEGSAHWQTPKQD
jgi:hypothetical protein